MLTPLWTRRHLSPSGDSEPYNPEIKFDGCKVVLLNMLYLVTDGSSSIERIEFISADLDSRIERPRYLIKFPSYGALHGGKFSVSLKPFHSW